MGRRKFTPEFKFEAIKLVRECGMTAGQAAKDLGLHVNVLRKWVKDEKEHGAQAFPGQGRMRSDDAEVDRLKRELAKARAERDVLKKSHRLLRAGTAVRFQFIAKHLGAWRVNYLCGALGVSRGGFYEWLNRSPSRHEQVDRQLLAQVRASFEQSDSTYGSPRVWRDLRAWGYPCSRGAWRA